MTLSIPRISVLASIVGLLGSASLVADGAPIAPHPVAHRSVAPARHNPHLHLRLPEPHHGKEIKKTGEHVIHSHVRRWLYCRWCGYWTVIHHHFGEITGTVTDSAGYAIEEASLHLTGMRGHRLAGAQSRHATATSSDGTYLMIHVRTGRYRVYASNSALGQGYAHVHVHTGVRHEVNVKLPGTA